MHKKDLLETKYSNCKIAKNLRNVVFILFYSLLLKIVLFFLVTLNVLSVPYKNAGNLTIKFIFLN